MTSLARRDAREREMIVSVLARAQAEPAVLVPVLVKCLQDPDAKVRAAAAGALGRQGTNALVALPELARLGKETNSEVSDAAKYAVEHIQQVRKN